MLLPPRPAVPPIQPLRLCANAFTRSSTTTPLTSQHLPPAAAATARPASSSASASARWKSRQAADPYTRASRLAGLKSRAAFKLLEIDARHALFRPGATVVDLGFAPGSWSQVAVARVRPRGRVVGIDVIPAQPPRGASALQGDFLHPATRARLRAFLREPGMGRLGGEGGAGNDNSQEDGVAPTLGEDVVVVVESAGGGGGGGGGGEVLGVVGRMQRARSVEEERLRVGEEDETRRAEDEEEQGDSERVVDVVLSDMSAPWPLAVNPWVKSVVNPYLRMMNTSGMAFRDHAGSMDLCLSALDFCYDTLVKGGHFLCKFYAGSEDGALEKQLKKLFEKVYRIKPDSSRKESKEAYFVALRRRSGVPKAAVFNDP